MYTEFEQTDQGLLIKLNEHGLRDREVEGGIVQSVMSTDPNIEVVVIDYDSKGDERVIISDIQTPEKIKTEKVYDLFKKQKDADEKYVYKELKKLNF